jgi:hypothetical protein
VHSQQRSYYSRPGSSPESVIIPSRRDPTVALALTPLGDNTIVGLWLSKVVAENHANMCYYMTLTYECGCIAKYFQSCPYIETADGTCIFGCTDVPVDKACCGSYECCHPKVEKAVKDLDECRRKVTGCKEDWPGQREQLLEEQSQAATILQDTRNKHGSKSRGRCRDERMTDPKPPNTRNSTTWIRCAGRAA